MKSLLAPPIAAVRDGPTSVPTAASTAPFRARTQMHRNYTRDLCHFGPTIVPSGQPDSVSDTVRSASTDKNAEFVYNSVRHRKLHLHLDSEAMGTRRNEINFTVPKADHSRDAGSRRNLEALGFTVILVSSHTPRLHMGTFLLQTRTWGQETQSDCISSNQPPIAAENSLFHGFFFRSLPSIDFTELMETVFLSPESSILSGSSFLRSARKTAYFLSRMSVLVTGIEMV
ncbi:hypothetical protein RB195_008345 [Necator americanus]|uniref:Uncharacterized protein n=1 Tax=Necator americanus TaxID=51031 RepID=A0ABR1CN67_NECAM